MDINQRINAFSKLGDEIKNQYNYLKQGNHNAWFTNESLDFALTEISNSLSSENLFAWISNYPTMQNQTSPKKIGVISAGNIPLVGFHDFLSVLISGHKFVGKLSTKDDVLLPRIRKILIDIEPRFKDFISLSSDKLAGFDAVIATGSNNSARYFEYYFGKYPHIIRKNRNSIAILSGNESDNELQLLADDIFLYFGLGCRSVSKLFIPDGYDLNRIFKNSLKHKAIINHNKYANNYDYNRAIYIMNLIDFKENGILMLKEDIGTASPVSVVFYEYYSKPETVLQRIEIEKNQIQCVVADKTVYKNAVAFGESQKPKLNDYADNIDTIDFLSRLS